MADIAIWQDKSARESFIAESKAIFEEIRGELEGQEEVKVVAIEPRSGDYFAGATLGKADRAAYERYPDEWAYFVRIDDPDAAIPLPTW